MQSAALKEFRAITSSSRIRCSGSPRVVRQTGCLTPHLRYTEAVARAAPKRARSQKTVDETFYLAGPGGAPSSEHWRLPNCDQRMKPDLFTFVAEIAVERGDPIAITCNCGSVITIMPPLQEEVVICPGCELRIKLMVLSGDPGYVLGRAPDGEPMLIPVQGSSREELELSPAERRRVLEEARKHWEHNSDGAE